MKTKTIFISLLFLLAGMAAGFSQVKQGASKTKVEVYYFHPTDRCPIDQSIEVNTVRLMRESYAKEVKDGTIRLQVINTDDKTKAKLVERFDINAQALYLVKLENGRETRNDMTHFAFSHGLSNPGRFRDGLKEEIQKMLSQK